MLRSTHGPTVTPAAAAEAPARKVRRVSPRMSVPPLEGSIYTVFRPGQQGFRASSGRRLEEATDVLGNRRGPSPLVRRGGAGPPNANLEAAGAQCGSHRDLVLHAKGLFLHPHDRGADVHLVAVADRRHEGRPGLDDRNTDDGLTREHFGPGQPKGLEQRLGAELVPFVE